MYMLEYRVRCTVTNIEYLLFHLMITDSSWCKVIIIYCPIIENVSGLK